jgi:hypothetical protein
LCEFLKAEKRRVHVHARRKWKAMVIMMRRIVVERGVESVVVGSDRYSCGTPALHGVSEKAHGVVVAHVRVARCGGGALAVMMTR